eukprot:5099028-Amphidinium_carterae.3
MHGIPRDFKTYAFPWFDVWFCSLREPVWGKPRTVWPGCPLRLCFRTPCPRLWCGPSSCHHCGCCWPWCCNYRTRSLFMLSLGDRSGQVARERHDTV